MANNGRLDLERLIEIITDINSTVKENNKEEARKIRLYFIGDVALLLSKDREKTKTINVMLESDGYRIFEELSLDKTVYQKRGIEIYYCIERHTPGYRFPKVFKEKSAKVDIELDSIEVYRISLIDVVVSKLITRGPYNTEEVKNLLKGHPEIKESSIRDRYREFEVIKAERQHECDKRVYPVIEELFK